MLLYSFVQDLQHEYDGVDCQKDYFKLPCAPFYDTAMNSSIDDRPDMHSLGNLLTEPNTVPSFKPCFPVHDLCDVELILHICHSAGRL